VALATLKTGVNTSFWKLLKKILTGNIEALTTLILQGRNLKGEEATKEEMDRLRDKLNVYAEVRDTPERMIRNLTSEGSEVPTVDPFQTVPQLRKERMESTESSSS